jgi:hypothetical protein
MKYLAILGFLLGASAAAFLPGCNGKSLPGEKPKQYTVAIGNVFVVCKKFDGQTLSDCSVPELGVQIQQVRNATNVVVEEIQ